MSVLMGRQIDFTIVLFGFLGTFTKFIDKLVTIFEDFSWSIANSTRANLQTAFVSGMKEDLGLYGNVSMLPMASYTRGGTNET